MRAVVEKVDEGMDIDDEGHYDTFCGPMTGMIGQEIEVEPKEGFENWFVGYLDKDTPFNFHKFWLHFLEEKED